MATTPLSADEFGRLSEATASAVRCCQGMRQLIGPTDADLFYSLYKSNREYLLEVRGEPSAIEPYLRHLMNMAIKAGDSPRRVGAYHRWTWHEIAMQIAGEWSWLLRTMFGDAAFGFKREASREGATGEVAIAGDNLKFDAETVRREWPRIRQWAASQPDNADVCREVLLMLPVERHWLERDLSPAGGQASGSGLLPPAEAPQDGPFGMDGFLWSGELYRGLSSKAFQLVKALWGSKDHTLELIDAQDAVYGEEGLAPEQGLDGLRRTANAFFRKHGLLFVVSIDKKQRRVAISAPRAKATRARKRTKKSPGRS